MRITIPPSVYWHEGMLLLPQHFQLTAEKTDTCMKYYPLALNPYNYGITNLSFDTELLAQKVFRILELEAIMPDGQIIQYYNSASIPALEINFNGIPIYDKPIIYLCLLNEDIDSTATPSRRPVEWSVKDSITAEDIQIACTRPVLALQLSKNSPENYCSLPIFRISDNTDYNYIPPCLRLTADNKLFHYCSETINLLKTKAGILFDTQQNIPSQQNIHYNTIHRIIQHLPMFESALRSEAVHPLNLFLIIQSIRGEIYAENSVPEIIDYSHDDILCCYTKLLTSISKQLDLLVTDSCTKVPFNKTDNAFKIKLQPKNQNKIRIGVEINLSHEFTTNWIEAAVIGYKDQINTLILRRSRGFSRKQLPSDEIFSRNLLFYDLEIIPETEQQLVIQAPKESGTMKRPRNIYLIK